MRWEWIQRHANRKKKTAARKQEWAGISPSRTSLSKDNSFLHLMLNILSAHRNEQRPTREWVWHLWIRKRRVASFSEISISTLRNSWCWSAYSNIVAHLVWTTRLQCQSNRAGWKVNAASGLANMNQSIMHIVELRQHERCLEMVNFEKKEVACRTLKTPPNVR